MASTRFIDIIGRKYKKDKDFRKHKVHRKRRNLPKVTDVLRPQESKLKPNHKGNLFLSNYKVAVRFMSDKYEIPPVAVEFLMVAYSFEVFTVDDMCDMSLTSRYFAKKEFRVLLDKGFVVLYRRRKACTSEKHLYKMTYQSQKFINVLYQLVLGTKEYPEYY